jgi:phosphohistidine phosphatase SixA
MRHKKKLLIGAAAGTLALLAIASNSNSHAFQSTLASNLTPKTVAVNVATNKATVSLTGPAQSDITKTYTLTGQVRIAGDTVPNLTEITIVRTFGKQVRTYHVPTEDENGSFTFSQSVLGKGTYSYTAEYPGDKALGIASAKSAAHTLKATLLTPSLTLTSPATYNYHPTMHVTVNLGKTYTNRTVYVYAQPVGLPKKLIEKGNVNSNGQLTAFYHTPYTTKFTVVYKGDARDYPKTVTGTYTVLAAVQLKLSGFYKSEIIDGTMFRLYHRLGQLVVTETVLPKKYGACGFFEVQEHYDGAWHANMDTSCTDLSADSQVYGYLNMTGATQAYEYRIRAHFLRSSTDNSDASNTSGWQYVLIEP